MKNTTHITTSAIETLSVVDVCPTPAVWRKTAVRKLVAESVPKNLAGANDLKIRKTAKAILNPSLKVRSFEFEV